MNRFSDRICGIILKKRRSIMARFECNRCGKCCRNFGKFMNIERQLTVYGYYCWYGIRNELFPALVQPQYPDMFSDTLDEVAVQL